MLSAQVAMEHVVAVFGRDAPSTEQAEIGADLLAAVRDDDRTQALNVVSALVILEEQTEDAYLAAVVKESRRWKSRRRRRTTGS